jgi:putative tricarboxylic transport membrane protein
LEGYTGGVNIANRITAVFAVVLAALYIYATSRFPALDISDPLGPRAFPYMIGTGLLLSAAALLVETFRAKKPEKTAEEQKMSGERRHYWVVGAAAIWTGLYLAVFEWLGYALSTGIYLLLLMACFHRGKWTGNILTAVLYSFVSYWVFTKLLGVSLPRGILPF